MIRNSEGELIPGFGIMHPKTVEKIFNPTQLIHEENLLHWVSAASNHGAEVSTVGIPGDSINTGSMERPIKDGELLIKLHLKHGDDLDAIRRDMYKIACQEANRKPDSALTKAQKLGWRGII